MGRTISATEARVHFGEVLRRVAENDETIVVERGGKPQVVLLSVAEYERLRAGRPERQKWREKLDRAHAAILADLDGREMPDIDQLIHDMREERDAQILDAVLGREPGRPSADAAP